MQIVIIIILGLLLSACDATTESGQAATATEDQAPKEMVEQESVKDVVVDKLVQHGSLVLKDYRNDCWHQVELHNQGRVSAISHPSITCIESYSEQDLSPDRNISFLHTLSKGVLDDGHETTEIEKYACYFIHTLSGLFSEGHTGSICSGEWSDSNHWVVSEEERYSIPELFLPSVN